MFTDYHDAVTVELSCKRIMNEDIKIPPHSKGIAYESNYQKSSDNVKRLSRLTAILNLLQLLMF